MVIIEKACHSHVVGLASPVGVVNLVQPVDVVDLTSPVGVVNLATPVILMAIDMITWKHSSFRQKRFCLERGHFNFWLDCA